MSRSRRLTNLIATLPATWKIEIKNIAMTRYLLRKLALNVARTVSSADSTYPSFPARNMFVVVRRNLFERAKVPFQNGTNYCKHWAVLRRHAAGGVRVCIVCKTFDCDFRLIFRNTDASATGCTSAILPGVLKALHT